MDCANELDIAWKIKEQYNSSAAADRYAEYFKGSLRHRRKDQREKKCIARGLSQVPRGSLVLDLPCGTGRMYPLLKDLDLHVVEADSSPYMVDHARRKAEELGLSGGQKQRVAIARALVKDPRILILDDCFSAVDTGTEERILESLRDVRRGRTTILISHRISTLKEADEIIVLDEGQVVERGDHESLVAAGGLYAEIHRRQLLEAELSSDEET